MKNLFIAEVVKIHNDAWRDVCLALVEELPEYFWSVPASSSGKYHPACDLGEGGLVRHSIMVCRVGLDLLLAKTFIDTTEDPTDTTLTEYYEDMVRIATLFHDCMKQGSGEGAHTVFNHPLLAGAFLEEKLRYAIGNHDASVIADAVRSHMGQWNTSKYDPDTVLPLPNTAFEKLIHTADFIASRKYMGGLEEWSAIS